MGRVARSKKHIGNSGGRLRKTKRRKKDLDQIWTDLLPENYEKSKKELVKIYININVYINVYIDTNR